MKNKYNLGQIVFLTTDTEQLPRIITSITFNLSGLYYTLVQGINSTTHYEQEISPEIDILSKFNND